jgi:NTE family protein
MTHNLGIVLSGGGARGVAQIGVLEALAERGIVPDCVSGTSSGALVGALYCAGHDTETMLQFFESRSPFRLSKFTLLKPGIVDTAKVVENLRDYFPQDRFEALQRPLFISATDYIEARTKVFHRGALIAPILASSSFPGVFTPMEIGGHLYGDGGILANFPVEPLAGQCRSILGVYVSPLRRIGASDLDSMLDVTQRALEIGMFQAARVKFGLCDAILCPDELENYGTFDTKHVREIFQIGYRAAHQQLDQIERRLTRKSADSDSDPT